MWQVETLYSERGKLLAVSDIRAAFRLAERPEIISFAGGFPTGTGFPLGEIQTIASDLIRDGERSFQYGPTEGLKELRAAVAGLAQSHGIEASSDNVLVTNGSQQALDLIAKVFIDPGDIVLVERPGYVGGINALQTYQAKPVGVPVDENGLDVEALASTLASLRRDGRRAKLLYTVPNFNNPTGYTLSAERRGVLANLAREYGFIIVEDDPYGEIWFEGQPPAPIAAGCADGHVLYLGSFSKIFLPGIRVGWVVGAEQVISKLAVAKQSADLCTGTFSQALALGFLQRGLLPRQGSVVRAEYRHRRDVLLGALADQMPDGVGWTRPRGGFFVWLTLPDWCDVTRLQPLALEDQVAFVPGTGFCTDGGGRNAVRLSYSLPPVELIPEGVRRLVSAINRLQFVIRGNELSHLRVTRRNYGARVKVAGQ